MSSKSRPCSRILAEIERRNLSSTPSSNVGQRRRGGDRLREREGERRLEEYDERSRDRDRDRERERSLRLP